LGIYIEEEGTQDLTPVDYVARAIIYLSRQSSSLGKTFHLTNPHPVPFSQFGKYISSYSGHKGKKESSANLLKPLRYGPWRSHFVEKFQARKQFEEERRKKGEKEAHDEDGNQDCALFGLFPYFSESYGDYINGKYPQTVFGAENTLAGLKGTDIICPTINEELIHTYLAYLDRKGLIP